MEINELFSLYGIAVLSLKVSGNIEVQKEKDSPDMGKCDD